MALISYVIKAPIPLVSNGCSTSLSLPQDRQLGEKHFFGPSMAVAFDGNRCRYLWAVQSKSLAKNSILPRS
jgi:hypothetical protein